MTYLEHEWGTGTGEVKALEHVKLRVKFTTVSLHHHSFCCTLSQEENKPMVKINSK